MTFVTRKEEHGRPIRRQGLFHLGMAAFLVVLTALDQWTKILAKSFLEGSEGITIIPGVFRLQYLENQGAAFGIFQGRQWFLLAVFAVLIVFLGYVYWKMPKTFYYLPLFLLGLMLLAGGIGNSIDRFFRGYVVDFLYFSLIDFPVFNVADIYVVVSCISMLLLFLFTRYREESFEFLKHKTKE